MTLTQPQPLSFSDADKKAPAFESRGHADLLAVVRPSDFDTANFTDPLQSATAREQEMTETAAAVVRNNRKGVSHFTEKQLKLMGLEPLLPPEAPTSPQRIRRAAQQLARVTPITRAPSYLPPATTPRQPQRAMRQR